MLRASRQVRLVPVWGCRRNLSAEYPPSAIVLAPHADQRAQLGRPHEGSYSSAWFPPPTDRASLSLEPRAKRKRLSAQERPVPTVAREGPCKKRLPDRVRSR